MYARDGEVFNSALWISMASLIASAQQFEAVPSSAENFHPAAAKRPH